MELTVVALRMRWRTSVHVKCCSLCLRFVLCDVFCVGFQLVGRIPSRGMLAFAALD